MESTLQEVEQLLKLLAFGRLMQTLAHKERQFVRQLAHSRHAHCAHPIEVHVRHFVRKPLNDVWLQSSIVEQHIVAGRRNGALADALRHNEEIISANRTKSKNNEYAYN